MSENYDEKFYEEGFTACLENSVSLLKIAEISAENKEYGIAMSLAILSAEEGIKGFICMARKINPDYPVENFEALFESHTVKHRHICEVISNLEFSASILTNIFRMISSAFDKFRVLDSDRINASEPLNLINLKEPNEFVKKLIKWSANADSEKQRGFYVFKNNNRWYGPQQIKKQKYSEAHTYACYLVDIMKAFKKGNLEGFIHLVYQIKPDY
ncbi:AbiV family abortive infection protein [Dyadobacter sp. 3J3]|uniref:AbiV family abortive infection protein n=1 Tax=Dyadobacter sp. 3J3 TaxID=2606600 RepID=UPI00135BCDCF|nr:AbiV family abortive infection protein [Dyadobacter sp. 3J3]